MSLVFGSWVLEALDLVGALTLRLSTRLQSFLFVSPGVKRAGGRVALTAEGGRLGLVPAGDVAPALAPNLSEAPEELAVYFCLALLALALLVVFLAGAAVPIAEAGRVRVLRAVCRQRGKAMQQLQPRTLADRGGSPNFSQADCPPSGSKLEGGGEQEMPPQQSGTEATSQTRRRGKPFQTKLDTTHPREEDSYSACKPIETNNEQHLVRVCFVLAHPDDEVMFFLPTIKCFVQDLRARQKIQLFLLCLSNGSAGGIGRVRSSELVHVCSSQFGISPQRLRVVDSQNLQDGFHSWPEQHVASEVKQFVDLHNIHVLLTFDERGVSDHPNHISTYRGVCAYLRDFSSSSASSSSSSSTSTPSSSSSTPASSSIPSSTSSPSSSSTTASSSPSSTTASSSLSSSSRQPPFVLFLKSTNLISKYLGLLDLFLTAAQNELVVVQWSPIAGLRAMRGYSSQLVWYRVLFLCFSRFAYINSFREFDEKLDVVSCSKVASTSS
eukprot:GHVT01031927.1.p1 GENE.GHVT01031927.1~~GHVT01031927.1.p1  ORF type:complete len:496 (-),score=134.07 GHVT01031927.1:257-1744(-)